MTAAANGDSSPPGPVRKELMCLYSALMFMTRIPMPALEYRPELFGRSIIYFPIVGLLVGVIGAIVFLLASQLWASPVAVAFALIATIVSTGAFHEDGLADTADGIGGGWTTEDKLNIMKDSRIGTYGSVALMLAILLKFAALATLPPDMVPVALIAGHVLGRWSTVPLLRYSNYVGGGSANPFLGAATGARLAITTVLSLGLIAIIAPPLALPLGLLAATAVFICRWYFKRKIGGITGDCLGAGNQVVEVSCYLYIAAIFTT